MWVSLISIFWWNWAWIFRDDYTHARIYDAQAVTKKLNIDNIYTSLLCPAWQPHDYWKQRVFQKQKGIHIGINQAKNFNSKKINLCTYTYVRSSFFKCSVQEKYVGGNIIRREGWDAAPSEQHTKKRNGRKKKKKSIIYVCVCLSLFVLECVLLIVFSGNEERSRDRRRISFLWSLWSGAIVERKGIIGSTYHTAAKFYVSEASTTFHGFVNFFSSAWLFFLSFRKVKEFFRRIWLFCACSHCCCPNALA